MLFTLLSVAFTACAPARHSETQAPPNGSSEAVSAEEAPRVDPLKAAREKARQRQAIIERLLDQAQEAVDDNRLTLPLHDNAYDRYAAVRILEPDNPQAVAGLESILLSYAELIRAALRKGNLAYSQQLLERAQSFYSGNSLLQDLAHDIQQAEALARQQAGLLQQQTAGSDEFLLPVKELTQKSPDVVELLTRIAERVRESRESVLILARTDAEGRWIYKQMNDAVPGYRIRGDIRIGASPKLQLLPPL